MDVGQRKAREICAGEGVGRPPQRGPQMLARDVGEHQPLGSVVAVGLCMDDGSVVEEDMQGR